MSARDVILVSGAAGFVGSHFARMANEAGSRVIAFDDMSSNKTWPALPAGIQQHLCGIESGDVKEMIECYGVTSVVHFAGDICVGESVTDPARYFDRNVIRSLALLESVRSTHVRAFVFSSTAAVYGVPERSPIAETERYAPINPYGATKLAIEYALASYGQAYNINWAALRYFNAAGAHPDGTLRERHDPETHLIPLAIDAALGKVPPLVVHGNTYATPDGTCVRDYVHVQDLARAHLAALERLDHGTVCAVNLGSGTGRSVLQVIEAVERVGKRPVPRTVGPRRGGDPPSLVAAVEHAHAELGWRTEHSSLDEIVEDAWRSRF